jgi:phosphoribosylanthranilate isomerase
VSVTPKIKICGITTVQDAEQAVSLGAWSIGLIFARSSPRRVSAVDAAAISSAVHRKTLVTGVFLNHPLDEVVKLHERVGFDLVQLHGDEGPSFASEVARRTGAKVIKAMRVRDHGDVRALDAFRTVDFHLVDGPGSGETIELGLLRNRRSHVPLLLAGGLTPENVVASIAAVQPWGVDVASGVEAEPGIKDPAKVEAFFAAVRSTGPAPAAVAPRMSEQERLAARVAEIERLPRADEPPPAESAAPVEEPARAAAGESAAPVGDPAPAAEPADAQPAEDPAPTESAAPGPAPAPAPAPEPTPAAAQPTEPAQEQATS